MKTEHALSSRSRRTTWTLATAGWIAVCALAAAATPFPARAQGRSGGATAPCPDCGMWRMDQRMCPMGWGRPVVTIAPQDLPDRESEGAQVLKRYCGQCHGVPSPRSHSPQEWTATVTTMLQRMRTTTRDGGGSWGRWNPNVQVPSEDEATKIRAYLEGHGLRSAPEGAVDKSKPGAETFARVCSKCHALPDPAQHTGSEWPAVVERMKRNMGTMNVGTLDEKDQQTILSFLGSKP